MPKPAIMPITLVSALLAIILLGSGCFMSPEERFQQELSKAQDGNRSAQLRVGEAYLKHSDGEQAHFWLEKAANAGSARAAFKLSEIYAKGLYGPKDEKTSMDWLEKSAKLGHTDAQYYIGYAYLLGTEPKVDIPIGLDWLKKASSNHQPDAGFLLGSLYLGRHIEQIQLPVDEVLARKYLSQAGLDGSTLGAAAYAYMLEKGQGGPVDKTEAFAWYALAAADGNEQAAQYATALQKTMTKGEVHAAELRMIELGFKKGYNRGRQRRRLSLD